MGRLNRRNSLGRGDDNVWTCKVCGKKATKGGKPDMRDHIEANHVEGVSHPCNICGKTYKLVYVEHGNFKTSVQISEDAISEATILFKHFPTQNWSTVLFTPFYWPSLILKSIAF